MHWEQAALSKGIWHVEKRRPAEVFVKPKNKQREATNLLHVYKTEAALQAERQLTEASPVHNNHLNTSHTLAHRKQSRFCITALTGFHSLFSFNYVRNSNQDSCIFKKKRKTEGARGHVLMVRLWFLWRLFSPSVCLGPPPPLYCLIVITRQLILIRNIDRKYLHNPTNSAQQLWLTDGI